MYVKASVKEKLTRKTLLQSITIGLILGPIAWILGGELTVKHLFWCVFMMASAVPIVDLIRPAYRWVALMVICIGCDATPPKDPSVDNTSDNPTTYRQKLVERFQTADVYEVNNMEFILRDTNGAVWYANRNNSLSGITCIFASIKANTNRLEVPRDDSVGKADAQRAEVVLRLFSVLAEKGGEDHYTNLLTRLDQLERRASNNLFMAKHATKPLVEDPDVK